MIEWSYTWQDLDLSRKVDNVLGTGDEGMDLAKMIIRSLNAVDEDLKPADQYQAKLARRIDGGEWEEVGE